MKKTLIHLLMPLLFMSCLINYSTDKLEFTERLLKNTFISDIVFESNGTAWLASSISGANTLIKIDTSGAISYYNSDNSSIDPDINIQDMEVDCFDRLWLGNDGLIMHDNGVFTQYNTSNYYMPGNTIASIVCDQLGKVWAISRSAGYWSGLILVENDSVHVYDESSSDIPSEIISDVEIDQENTIWILALGNVYTFDGSTWESISHDSLELNSYTINDLAFDHEGRLCGVLYNTNASEQNPPGLFIFEDGQTTLFNTPPFTLPKIEIDSNGRIWVCDFMSELRYFDGEELISPNFNHDAAVAAVAPDGKLWVGGMNGVFIYDFRNDQ